MGVVGIMGVVGTDKAEAWHKDKRHPGFSPDGVRVLLWAEFGTPDGWVTFSS